MTELEGTFHTKLASYVNLRRGWDSYDAPTPSIKSINKAREFLHFVFAQNLKPNRVEPSVVGGIGITWWRGTKEAYLEFQNSNIIGLVFEHNNKDEISIDVLHYDFEFEPVAQQIKEYLNNEESHH